MRRFFMSGNLHLENDVQFQVRGKHMFPRRGKPACAACQRGSMLEVALNHLASTGKPDIESHMFATL